MAEGGPSPTPSTSKESNADRPHLQAMCTPCQEGSITEEATKFCPTCEEYLCASCTVHHGRQRATRSHKLVKQEDAQKQESMSAVSTKCLCNTNHNVEMYCSSHDMVYCNQCIAKEHRTCSWVTNIGKHAKTARFGPKKLKVVKSDIKTEYKRLLSLKQKKQENITSIEQEKDIYNGKIENIERRLIANIQNLRRNTASSLETAYSDAHSRLESDIAKISNIIERLKRTTEVLENVSEMDKPERFVELKVANQLSADSRRLQRGNTLSIKFTEEEGLNSLLDGLKMIGTVTLNIEDNKSGDERKPVKVLSRKDINVKMEDQNSCSSILDVCLLESGTVILADHSNENIKRLASNDALQDLCMLEAKPTSVCSVGGQTVAVKMDNNKVQFIDVDATFTKLNQIDILGGAVCGLAYCQEKLFVSTSNSVCVYTLEGQHLQTIDMTSIGRNINGFQHIAAIENTVFVTGHDDGVMCFSADGCLQQELRDKRLQNNRGICISPNGTVFLSGYTSKNIVMFSKNGFCLGELVSANDGLGFIISLCYDDRRNCILVTSDSPNKVFRLELSI